MSFFLIFWYREPSLIYPLQCCIGEMLGRKNKTKSTFNCVFETQKETKHTTILITTYNPCSSVFEVVKIGENYKQEYIVFINPN